MAVARVSSALAWEVATFLDAPIYNFYEYFRYVGGSPIMLESTVLPGALEALRSMEIERALDLTGQLVNEFPNEPNAHVMKLHAVLNANNRGLLSDSSFTVHIDRLAAVDRLNPHIQIWRAEIALRNDPDGTGVQHALDILRPELERKDLKPSVRGYVLRVRRQQDARFRVAPDPRAFRS